MRTELIALFGKPRAAELDQSQLPDFLKRYLELASAYTDARPGLLLTAFLPFCAVNLGNRVHMFNNSMRIFPNIWSCVIGPSSVSRKTTALRYGGYTLEPHEAALREAALETYEERTLVLNGCTLSKLMSYLAANSTRLFVHNEISGWLHEMAKSFNAGYKQTITELFDGVDRAIANRERTERINRPALSIAAASTEGWLFRGLMDGTEQLGGFLQRMLFYVVRNVKLDEINLTTLAASDLEERLAVFDSEYFQWWRAIPGSHRLGIHPEALDLRNEFYQERYRRWFPKSNDALMSYFTRVYDGYWFKFCMLITLAKFSDHLRQAVSHDGYGPGQDGKFIHVGPPSCFATDEFFRNHVVDLETAIQAFHLCDFYIANTVPLLQIMEEQDKLAGERKLLDLLIHRFGGRAGHSVLLNASHMKKREFKECVESLIEREAIRVETYMTCKNKPGRVYVVDPELYAS